MCNAFKILPRHECISIHRQFNSTMENNYTGIRACRLSYPGDRGRLIGSFIHWYGRPVDLPRVIEILCLFTNGAQRNEWKDIKKLYHEWKTQRCSISTHKSTYFFRKQHLFSYTHTYVWLSLIDTTFTYQVLLCTTS